MVAPQFLSRSQTVFVSWTASLSGHHTGFYSSNHAIVVASTSPDDELTTCGRAPAAE